MTCEYHYGAPTAANAYLEQFLQRVDDLVRLEIAENIDDLSMPRLALGVYDIFQSERLVWLNNRLARCGQSGLGVGDYLQLDVAGVGLLGDIFGDSLLQGQSGDGLSEAVGEGGRARRRPIAQSSDCARHCRVCVGDANCFVGCPLARD